MTKKTTNNKPHVKMSLPPPLPPYQRLGNVPSDGVMGAKVIAKATPVLPKRSDYLGKHNRKPILRYTAKAHAHMTFLVENCPIELGWVGAIEQVSQWLYIVHDLRVMIQEAGPTTFEYDDWNKPVTEMLMSGSMCVGRFDANLGHSHVNMGVTPSGTDEEQMMDLGRIEDGKPQVKFSVQTIVNKRGDQHCSIFDWEHEVHYDDCPIEVMPFLTPEEIIDLTEQLTRVKRYTYTTPARTYGAYAGNVTKGGTQFGFGRQHAASASEVAAASAYQQDLGFGDINNSWGYDEGSEWPEVYTDAGTHNMDDPEWDEQAWDMWAKTQATEIEVSSDQFRRNTAFFIEDHPDWDALAKDDWADGYSESVVEHRFTQRKATQTTEVIK